ncbi:MAG: oligoribonuclease [Zetaproteobacteria bacterium]|nr:MAG: oligoribonuclease [Zetaproteobacteria bacterium]
MSGAATRSKLVWLDLEMTGLDPERDTILEIATVITDDELEIVAEGPDLVVHQPESVLEGMDAWCRAHHGASGLTERVRASTVSLADAERRTLEFVAAHTERRSAPLCGNSIHQDRRFLRRYMPELEAWFHYRIIDVSTVKELVSRWYGPEAVPEKAEGHRAMEDVRESIAELRHYRSVAFLPRR